MHFQLVPKSTTFDDQKAARAVSIWLFTPYPY